MTNTRRFFSSSNQRRHLAPFGRIVLICLCLAVVGLFGPIEISAEMQRNQSQATNPDDRKTAPAAVAAQENIPPVAVADSATLPKNTSVAINILVNDYDPDPSTTPAGQIDPTSVTITTKPRAGARIMVSETGMVTYAPKRNFRGFDVFTYTVKDKEGATSNPAKVTITVKERVMTGDRK